MRSMATLREYWAELRASESATSSGFSLRLIAAANDVRVYAALKTPESVPAIMVEMPTTLRTDELANITTYAFEAVTSQFPGLSRGRSGISLVLRQPDYEDLFECLGDDLAMAVQRVSSGQDAIRAIARRIDRWRRFFERSRRRLSDEEMRGMIGELAILTRCIYKFGPAVSVAAWQGMGGLRDFELPDYSVETKTYQSETGAAVRINDPQQLEGSAARPVYLAVARLAKSDTSGYTLPDVIAYVESILQDESPVLDDFRDLLADCGYIAAESPRYTERFSINNIQLFAIPDDFPRIASASVPPGVTDVHFSILLAALIPHAVDSTSILGAPTALESV
jgi:hypothetical protein